MKFIDKFVADHEDMFVFLSEEEASPKQVHHHNVHPHDRLMAVTFLKLIPKNISPNKVTTFRILMTPIVFLIILSGHYFTGIILFLLVALTDVIDGSMARTRRQITKFGMMYDPLADKFLIGSLILLLVFEYYNFWLGIALLGIEIAFIVSALVVRYRFKTVRMANIWGKIKMLLQVIAVFFTLAALLFNFPYLFTIGAWLFGLAIGFALVSLFSQGI